MKKLLYLFALLCMATGFTSSCKESALDRSLSQAGDNRKELEAVLLHYQNDTLKQQAARFLIENMDAHYCFGGDAVEKYYLAMDSSATEKATAPTGTASMIPSSDKQAKPWTVAWPSRCSTSNMSKPIS